MNWIKMIFLIFLYIVACTIIASALFITFIIPETYLEATFLWQVILLSALCSLTTLIFYSNHELSKKSLLLRNIIHLFAIVSIMLGGSLYFRWINIDNTFSIVIMLISIVVVYIVVTVASFMNNKIMANQLNERLEQIKRDDEL